MYIRLLRQKSYMSQEELADKCKVSLRTIQRAEAGYRVSYATLRSLAEVFEINVDMLERELYAMNKNSEEFEEAPFWLRLIIGQGWRYASRRESLKIAAFFGGASILLLLFHFFVPFPSHVHVLGVQLKIWMVYASWGSLFFGSFLSFVRIYIGDKHQMWPELNQQN